jgi:predicted nucleic acid-binding protein
MYADTDFWLALLKDDDWLADRAERRLAEYRDDLTVSLATFIELCLVEERYAFDRERALLSIFELAESDVEEDVVFQASAYIDEGLNPFDAFHAALAGEAILSSDGAFDDLAVERVPLEEGG